MRPFIPSEQATVSRLAFGLSKTGSQLRLVANVTAGRAIRAAKNFMIVSKEGFFSRGSGG